MNKLVRVFRLDFDGDTKEMKMLRAALCHLVEIRI